MKHKILIIDDDADFVKESRKILQAEGFDVITASTGQTGFHKIRKQSPDMVLMHMLEKNSTNGADTARAIADDAAFAEIPVIMLTDSVKPLDEKYENLPVKEILEKPVSPEQLLATVRGHVQNTEKNRREILEEIDALIEKWKNKQGNLIMILHEIQNKYGYVPRGVSFELSRLLEVPMARICEVISFYNYFKTSVPGRHLISVCMGTACYLKGGGEVLKELKNILNVEEGQTSRDGVFQLQVVRCLGCCGLAPVMMIDETVHGNVNPAEIPEILSRYSDTNAPAPKGA